MADSYKSLLPPHHVGMLFLYQVELVQGPTMQPRLNNATMIKECFNIVENMSS